MWAGVGCHGEEAGNNVDNRLRSTEQRFVIRHHCAVTDRAKLPLLREGFSAPAGENWRGRNRRGRGLGRGAGCQRWKWQAPAEEAS